RRGAAARAKSQSPRGPSACCEGSTRSPAQASRRDLSTSGPVRHDAAVPRTTTGNPRRAVPAVERLLGAPAAAALTARYRRAWVAEAIRRELDAVRRAAADGTAVPDADTILARVAGRLAADARPRLARVVNATGVVLHTNLGRAPLPEAAIEALVAAARDPVAVEYDLARGERGDRDAVVADDLVALTGAEAALVVK